MILFDAIQLRCWSDDTSAQFLFANCQSISSHFVTVHSWSVRCSWRSQKSLKTPILEVQSLSKSSMLIRLQSSLLVLVVINSMPVVICNHFHERLANNGKITTFTGVPLFDAPVHRFPWAQKIKTWTVKICVQCWKFHTQLFHVYLNWFRRNLLLKCVSKPKITKKSIQTPYFGIQCHPRSLNLVAIKSQCTTCY